MIAVATIDIKCICMVQKEIYIDNPANSFFHSAESLKLFCCKSLAGVGYAEGELWACGAKSRERVICENSKCSYIERTFTLYCNRN